MAVLVVGALIAAGLIWLLLAPGQPNAADLKFMHCTTCGFERPYDQNTARERCLRCRPPKVGYYEATEKTVGGNSFSSPWKWFNIAVGFEVVVFLGGLVFVFQSGRERQSRENYLLCQCPYCNWRLRFRESQAAKGGKCPRCRRLFRFPEVDETDIEEEA